MLFRDQFIKTVYLGVFHRNSKQTVTAISCKYSHVQGEIYIADEICYDGYSLITK